jgi:long-chain acyl-CoA synthetase
VQPTIMVVVPRLFELLRARIIKSVEASGGFSKYLLYRAMKIGADKNDGRLKPWDMPMDGFLALTLRRKIRDKMGKRVKAWVSGGAPLNPEVGVFFQSLGITFLQGYGQTEAGPLVSCNRPSVGIRLETVGPPSMNTEVRIAGDGEIMVRGEMTTATGTTTTKARGCCRMAGSAPATLVISTGRTGSSSPTARRT